AIPAQVAATPNAAAAAPAPSAQYTAFTVRVVGQGPPVLLIPGLSCDGSVWDATVEHLHSKYQCHVFSLAGFAGTPAVEPPFLSQVHKQIVHYVKAEKLDHPSIIGHSLGGTMAF